MRQPLYTIKASLVVFSEFVLDVQRTALAAVVLLLFLYRKKQKAGSVAGFSVLKIIISRDSSDVFQFLRFYRPC